MPGNSCLFSGGTCACYQNCLIIRLVQREALNIEGQVFDNVYLWQRLDQPAAARIRACEEILKGGSPTGLLSIRAACSASALVEATALKLADAVSDRHRCRWQVWAGDWQQERRGGGSPPLWPLDRQSAAAGKACCTSYRWQSTATSVTQHAIHCSWSFHSKLSSQ